MFDQLYHSRILELAADIPHLGRLASPDGSAQKISRICGSRITVDLTLDADRRISDIGCELQACAIGQASTSVLMRTALGKSVTDITAGRNCLARMLDGSGQPPTAGDFYELRHFRGVRDYPQRHRSCMLAFETTLAAFADADHAMASAKDSLPTA